MDDEKNRRALTRQKKQKKEHQRRRHQGIKKQDADQGMSLAEFQKKFPHLPIKTWYVQKCFVGKGYDW